MQISEAMPRIRKYKEDYYKVINVLMVLGTMPEGTILDKWYNKRSIRNNACYGDKSMSIEMVTHNNARRLSRVCSHINRKHASKEIAVMRVNMYGYRTRKLVHSIESAGPLSWIAARLLAP